jgi:hypothetical protein
MRKKWDVKTEQQAIDLEHIMNTKCPGANAKRSTERRQKTLGSVAKNPRTTLVYFVEYDADYLDMAKIEKSLIYYGLMHK